MTEDVLKRLTSALGDRYRIEGELDRGGMAIVYLARDLRHGRDVAVKVLHPTVADTLGSDRFLREIEVIARLQHPHVLTLIDSGDAGGLPYYVMPYVEGLSLAQRLEEEGALPVEEAIRIAREVADALAYAHRHGVVHRDVKPANILLSDGHAVVADFGIAGALEYAATSRLTRTGVSLGSPAYMSPEQASGETELDHRTDLYSLGCVLFEMLAGEAPFGGGSIQAVLSRKMVGEVPSLRELREEVPEALTGVVERAMAVARDERFESADELGAALRSARPGTAAAPTRTERRRKRLGVALGAGAVVVLAGLLIVLQRSREESRRALWATRQVAEAERLASLGEFAEAFRLVREVEASVPDEDPVPEPLWDRISWVAPIRSEPPGARVYRQRHEAPADEWELLGTTPLDSARFVEDGGYRIRLELDGHRPVELLHTAIRDFEWRRESDPIDPVRLDPLDALPEEMVRIPGFTLDSAEYGDYFMDRFEVTNREYERFVDAGGYRDRRYWTEPFVEDGARVPWEEATARFEDRTGRPGPATWELGSYPEGRADHPVGGVSWYEAAAYARFAGKELPTRAHWNMARRFYRDDSWMIAPRSNLGGDGPRPVGEDRAMTTLGVYDLVGNVREWIVNEAPGGRRATRGAAWTDAPFHAGWIIPTSPWERHPTNGIRLVRTFEDEEKLAPLLAPVEPTERRDFSEETPASEAEFRIYARLYDYDPMPLNATVEAVDTLVHWVRERVSFDLPYGERGGAIIDRPLEGEPPFQTVVYWPGSGFLNWTSWDRSLDPFHDFFMRSGRAVAIPIFQGALHRDDAGYSMTWSAMTANPGGSAHRQTRIHWMQDLMRTVDYVDVREELDGDALAYYGLSWGGREAPIVLALEPRIEAAVLNVGGLASDRFLPEVDPFNFLPYVRTPVLMLNGEYDIVFPLEISQRPMFELLGTPPEDKKHHVTPASHLVPRDELIRETLDWLDRYLGVPGR